MKTILMSLTAVVLSTQYSYAHHTHYVVEEVVTPAPTVFVETPAIIVEQQPPADLVEEVSPSPGPNYSYVGGYWKWDGHWKWSSGKWIVRPHAEAVWVPGYWKDKHGRWEWKEGHWK